MSSKLHFCCGAPSSDIAMRYCAALHHIWLLMKIFGSVTFLILCMVSAIQKKEILTLEDFCLGRALLVRRYQSGNIC